MTTALNEGVLEDKLSRLEQARTWSPRLVSKLEQLLRTADDREVFRVNPLAFASARGVDEQEVVDLFLHASRLGLFQMNWALLCPQCATPVESLRTLKTLHNSYFCTMCHLQCTANLDDFIQVNFTVTPEVRDIRYNRPDELPIEDHILKYRFMPEGRLKGGPRFVDALSQMSKLMSWIEPGSSTHELELAEGYLIVFDHANQAGGMFQVGKGPAPAGQALALKIDGEAMTPNSGLVAAGPLALTFDNRSGRRGAVLAVALPPEYPQMDPKLEFEPFLTGARLLTSQAFRDLFRGEVLRGNDGVGVKDTTLLFTDLKGSTAMYDRIGDLKAYALVRQHFDRLERVVYQHAGAIVKTIGDAVMATFNTPEGSVRAALRMLDEIEEFNKDHGARELILKIGIHRGASIAVTLNDRPDYFGQTVNIAARVQGLADAEEIYVTQDVYEAPGVKEALAGYAVEPKTAQLKGVADRLKVYRIAETGEGARGGPGAANTAARRPRAGRKAKTPGKRGRARGR